MAQQLPPGRNYIINHRKKGPNYSMPSADVYRTYYGTGYMIAGDRLILSPGRSVVTNTGCLTFIDKNLYHRTTYVTDTPYEDFAIKFSEKAAQHIISIIGQAAFDSLFEAIVVHITPETEQQIQSLLPLLQAEYETSKEYSEAMMESLITQYFILAVRGRTVQLPQNMDHPETKGTLMEALTYLEGHFSEDPTLQETASAVHLSPSYLSKLFTRELGTSYSRFLTEEKINHAQKLLIGTNLSMVEIAAQCGFSNSNYFSDVFKKVIGVAPLTFRNHHK